MPSRSSRATVNKSAHLAAFASAVCWVPRMPVWAGSFSAPYLLSPLAFDGIRDTVPETAGCWGIASRSGRGSIDASPGRGPGHSKHRASPVAHTLQRASNARMAALIDGQAGEKRSAPRETGRQRGRARVLARPWPSGWARAPSLWEYWGGDALARIRVALRAVAATAVAAHVAGNPVARKAIFADAVAVPAPRRRRRRSWPEEPADRCGAGPGEEGGDHPPPSKTPTEFSCEVVNQRRVHGKHPFRSRAALEAGPRATQSRHRRYDFV